MDLESVARNCRRAFDLEDLEEISKTDNTFQYHKLR